MSYPSNFSGYFWYGSSKAARSSVYSYTLTGATASITEFPKMSLVADTILSEMNSSYSQMVYKNSTDKKTLQFTSTETCYWTAGATKGNMSNFVFYFNSDLVNPDTTSLEKQRTDFSTVGIFFKNPSYNQTVYTNSQIVTASYQGYNCEPKYGISQGMDTLPTQWYAEDIYSLLTAPTAGTWVLWVAADGESGYDGFSGRPVGTITVNALPDPTYTAPVGATGLVFNNGNLQVIAQPGTVSGGTMYYGLGSSTTSAPTSWELDYTDVIVQSAGDYYLWYKVIGDASHSSVGPFYAQTVTVAKADQSFEFTTPVNMNEGGLYQEYPTGTFFGTWSTSVVDESVCAAGVVNNELCLTALTAGTTRVDVTCSGNANYKIRTVQVFVTVTAQLARVFINGLYYKIAYYNSAMETPFMYVTKIVKGND